MAAGTGWGRGGKRRQTAGDVYSQIMGQARQPVFYEQLCVPDTVEGRLELVTIHVHAVMRRMRHLGPIAGPASQELVQYMFDDLDRSIREIGVGDMSMGKYMKRLGKNFYGRAEAYDQSLDAGDTGALRATLRRNVLATSDASASAQERASHALADYVVALNTGMESYDLMGLAGPLSFPEIHKEAA